MDKAQYDMFFTNFAALWVKRILEEEENQEENEEEDEEDNQEDDTI